MTTREFVIDALGTRHPQVGDDARIVSLVPSLTELLCDLGLADQLVGRTGFCIHPKATVRGIPKLGGTKDVDIDALRALAPTHVVVNIDENRRELGEELASFVDHIVVTHPLGPADNIALYELFGTLFRRTEAAQSLTQQFSAASARLADVEDKPRQRVLYLIWRDPWMTVSAETYIARMLELINWTTVPATAPTRYPAIELEAFAGRVDRVLLSSEPYAFRDKHIAEVSAQFGPDVDVSLVDGEMLSWYGSRAIAGLEYLAALCRGKKQAAA
ncbi:MAG: helical backbone metal receptor [Gammaproteobacteria bacterium]